MQQQLCNRPISAQQAHYQYILSCEQMDTEVGFFCHLFFAQKKNGETRLIISLNPLNTFMVIPSMKMETVQLV